MDEIIAESFIKNAELWNIKDLPPPPITTCKASLKATDVRLLQNVLRESLTFFTHQQPLHTEAALLSRLIYRMKTKFRMSKDFKTIEKLNRALRNYLHVNVAKSLTTIFQVVPDKYERDRTYLPTRNMLDYVLVRLQGLSKILARVIDVCLTAGKMCHERLKLGHFWNMAIIVLALVSRVFVLIKGMLKYTCELYGDLLPISSKLSNFNMNWLPENYKFPGDLHEWIGINWLELDRTVIEIPDEEPSYLDLIEDSDDDIEFCDEYILIGDSTVLDEEVTEIGGEKGIGLTGFTDVDVGEAVDLKINKKRKRDASPDEIICLEDSPPKKKKRLRGGAPLSFVSLQEEKSVKKKTRKKISKEKIEVAKSPEKNSSTRKSPSKTDKLHQKLVKKTSVTKSAKKKKKKLTVTVPVKETLLIDSPTVISPKKGNKRQVQESVSRNNYETQLKKKRKCKKKVSVGHSFQVNESINSSSGKKQGKKNPSLVVVLEQMAALPTGKAAKKRRRRKWKRRY